MDKKELDDWIFSGWNKPKTSFEKAIQKLDTKPTNSFSLDEQDYYNVYTNADDYLPDDEVKYNDKIYIVKSRNTKKNTLTIEPKWRPIGWKVETVTATKVKMHKPLGGNSYTDWGGYGKYNLCSHKMVEYKFPMTKDLSVYMSSHRAGKLESDLKPTHGVYLDAVWNDEIFTFNNSAEPIDTIMIDFDKQSKMFVDWPDQRAIDLTDFEFLVEHCWRLISMGRLEIGCIGGHGRTGTLLGGLILYHSYLIKQPIDFKTAMETVRDKYCNQAIESKAQENLLQEYEMLLGDKSYE